jgi:O-antigen ligase
VVLGLFLAWPLLSAWINGPLPDMWARWLHVFRAGLFIVFALSLPSRLKPSLWLGLLAGAAYMTAVVLVHQWIHPLPYWNIWKDLLEVRGNSSSQRWIVLAATAGCLLWLALSEEFSRQARWAALAGWLALSLVVGAYAASRNAHILLALLPSAVLVYKLGFTLRGLALSAVALGLAAALFAQLPGVEKRIDKAVVGLQKFKDSGNFESSAAVRVKMYLTAWENMAESPVTGTGLGSWQGIWAEASQSQPETSGYNNPHNDFLLWGMETGLPGALTLLAVLALILRGAYQQRSFEGGIGWVFGWALLATCTINAPFRDATLGMALIVFAVAFSTHTKAQRQA